MGNIELFDVEKEYDLALKKVKEKYGYDTELCNVLRKILPAMLTGKKQAIFIKNLDTSKPQYGPHKDKEK